MGLNRAEKPVIYQRNGGVITPVHVQVVGVMLHSYPVQGSPGSSVEINAAAVNQVDPGIDYRRNYDRGDLQWLAGEERHGYGYHVEQGNTDKDLPGV